MDHLSETKSRDLLPELLSRPRRGSSSSFVRGLHPVWVRDPFQEALQDKRQAHDPVARQKWSDETWERLFFEAEEPEQSTRQARLVLAWRLTRLLAQRAGRLEPADPLVMLPREVWELPGEIHCAADIARLPLQHYWPKDQRTPTHNWQALVPDDYAHWLKPPPEDHPHRTTWQAFCRWVVDRHHMHRGVEADPSLGRKGVRLLLEDPYLGFFWPEPEELQDFEQELAFSVLELLAGGDPNPKALRARRGHSRLAVVRELQREFNLTLPEAQGLLAMSRRLATDLCRATPEENRAVMELALERLAEQARQDLDLRNEATALKHLSQIQGLTQKDELGGMEEAIDALQVVSKEFKDKDEETFQKYLDMVGEDD